MQMQLNITSSIENGKSSEDGLTFGSRNHSVISSSINMSERERNHKRVNTSSEFRCIFIVHFEYLLAPCFKAKPLSKSPEIVARWTKFSSVSNAIQCWRKLEAEDGVKTTGGMYGETEVDMVDWIE